MLPLKNEHHRWTVSECDNSKLGTKLKPSTLIIKHIVTRGGKDSER